MTENERRKELIKQELDKQNLDDLKTVLSTKEGRRFFSWMIQECGFKDCDPKGNSKDFHNAGRRSVAVMLIFACDALGLEGVDLRQQAEKEYIIYQMGIAEDIKRKQKGGN